MTCRILNAVSPPEYDRASKSFSIACLRDGVLVALGAVNATRDFVHGKMAIGKGVKPDRGALADAGVALNSFNQEGAC